MLGDLLCMCINYTDATIGFTPESYTVNEEGGTVTLTVTVLSGMLQRPVEICFSTATTSNDPATGMVCSGISD